MGGGSVWYLPIKEDVFVSKNDFLFSSGNDGFGAEWFVEQILSFGVYFGPVQKDERGIEVINTNQDFLYVLGNISDDHL